MSMTSAKEMGSSTMTSSVMDQLMENIMASTPTSVQMDEITWLMLWFMLCVSVSISLVMRESVSP